MSKKSRAKRKGVRRCDLKLRVMAEYGSSGIWSICEIGYFRHGMIGYASLRLSHDLARRFDQWIELYEGNLAADFDSEEFNQIGRILARDLKIHMGSGYVEFIPELATGGLGQTEIIGSISEIEVKPLDLP